MFKSPFSNGNIFYPLSEQALCGTTSFISADTPVRERPEFEIRKSPHCCMTDCFGSSVSWTLPLNESRSGKVIQDSYTKSKHTHKAVVQWLRKDKDSEKNHMVVRAWLVPGGWGESK